MNNIINMIESRRKVILEDFLKAKSKKHKQLLSAKLLELDILLYDISQLKVTERKKALTFEINRAISALDNLAKEGLEKVEVEGAFIESLIDTLLHLESLL